MSITFHLRRPRQELDILEVGETLGLDLNKLLEFVHTEEVSGQVEEDRERSLELQEY